MDHRYLTGSGGWTIRNRCVWSDTQIGGDERVDGNERIDGSGRVDGNERCDDIERVDGNEQYHRSSASREPFVMATTIEERRRRCNDRAGESEIPIESAGVVQ